MQNSQLLLKQLQQWMHAKSVSAALFSVADRFQGEEIQPADCVIQALTGFEGSAGYFIVTPRSGILILDGRYTARGQQIANDFGFELLSLQPGALVHALKKVLARGAVWTSNVDVMPHALVVELLDALGEQANFMPMTEAEVSDWWTDRPQQNFAPVHQAAPILSSTPTTEKIATVWQQITNVHPETGCLIVCDLAEIAWLLNMRGSDTESLTTFRGRLAVQKRGGLILFRDGPFPDGVPQLEVRPEAALNDYLAQMTGQVWVSPKAAPFGLVEMIAPESRYLADSPIQRLKAVKSQDEVVGMREAHLKDALAVVRFLHWLDCHVPIGQIDEISAAEKLWDCRRRVGALAVSFKTISAVGGNAAMPHYRSSAQTNRLLTMDQIYLVDSGGQYTMGTTDITRTLYFGSPPNEIVRRHTLVLMGHIDVARAVFPSGVAGHQLDIIARQHLWAEGLDYDHGTGHGVGAGLNVHESPPTISGSHKVGSQMPFEPGMIVSNEPGYYEPDLYGIRIECLQVCQASTGAEGWLGFDVLTLVPIQRKLIDATLLTKPQRQWLNDYHAEVKAHLTPMLNEPGDEMVIDWLTEACKPL